MGEKLLPPPMRYPVIEVRAVELYARPRPCCRLEVPLAQVADQQDEEEEAEDHHRDGDLPQPSLLSRASVMMPGMPIAATAKTAARECLNDSRVSSSKHFGARASHRVSTCGSRSE